MEEPCGDKFKGAHLTLSQSERLTEHASRDSDTPNLRTLDTKLPPAKFMLKNYTIKAKKIIKTPAF